MDKYNYNEQNGLWYELQGDYYLPCLRLSEEETVHIGIWGQQHRRYLKSHHKVLYTSLLTSGISPLGPVSAAFGKAVPFPQRRGL